MWGANAPTVLCGTVVWRTRGLLRGAPATPKASDPLPDKRPPYPERSSKTVLAAGKPLS